MSYTIHILSFYEEAVTLYDELAMSTSKFIWRVLLLNVSLNKLVALLRLVSSSLQVSCLLMKSELRQSSCE